MNVLFEHVVQVSGVTYGHSMSVSLVDAVLYYTTFYQYLPVYFVYLLHYI